ncbi:MAG TPA: hypothetical protein VKR06_40945 [Ktedonosporobacter sp.]|nr:hypothetical protein [Ktedonosporobacter sp.]
MSNNIRPHIILGVITLVLAVILLALMLFRPLLFPPTQIIMPKGGGGQVSPSYHQVYASSYSLMSPVAGA